MLLQMPHPIANKHWLHFICFCNYNTHLASTENTCVQTSRALAGKRLQTFLYFRKY